MAASSEATMGPVQTGRVFVVEHDHDLGEMLADVLSSYGFQTEWRLSHPLILAEVREHQPDLLVVDLQPAGGETAYSLIDLLRSDESVRGLPVLAITTQDYLADGALASFNVKSSLVKPFDLPDFIEQVGLALNTPSFHRQIPPGTRPEGILALAEEVISDRFRELLLRWVQRLRLNTSIRERDDLRLAEVLDGVAIHIEALDAAFHSASPRQLLESDPKIAERLSRHAAARVGQRVPLEVVVQEHVLLREEIWRALWFGLPDQLDRREIATLQSMVDGTLDLIGQQTVSAYLAAQRQACGEQVRRAG